MKSMFVFVVLVFSFFNSVLGQSNWKYYSTDFWVQDIKIVEDDLFIGNPTGLHVIDIESKNGKLFQSVNSPLRGSFVWEMLAKDEYVWIALNEGGIAKYTFPGNEQEVGEWEQFFTGLGGGVDTIERARNMIEADDGSLWFEMKWWNASDFLYSLKDGVLQGHSNLFSETPHSFSCHGSKRIYFETNNALKYLELESVEIKEITLPSSDMTVHSITAFNDEIYVSMSNETENFLYRYQDEWNLISQTEEVLNLNNAQKGANRIWLNNYSLEPEFTAITQNTIEHFTLEDLCGNQVETGYRTLVLNEDESGYIYMVNYNIWDEGSFIYRIKDGEVTSYDIHHSTLALTPSLNEVGNFDCGNNLLLSDLTLFQTFKPDSLKITKVLPNRDHGDLKMIDHDPLTCKYYIVHDGLSFGPSYLYVFENDVLQDTIHLENGWIEDFHISEDGILFLANKGVGIYDSVNESWEWNTVPFVNPESPNLNYVFGIREHLNGAITFGTMASLVVYEDGVWTTYDKDNSPLDEGVFTHLIDSKGDILVEYLGGIYKFDGNQWEYTEVLDPTKDGIRSIYEDEYGNYLLGTFNSGVLYWNGFDFEHINVSNSSIPSNHISEIIQHPETKELWLMTDRGIAIWNRNDYTFRKGIFGKTYYDAQKNLEYNPGIDVGLSNVALKINHEQTILSDVNGNYAVYPAVEDSFSIQCNALEGYEILTETSYSDTFENQDIFDLNFGLWKELDPRPLEIDFAISPFLCSSQISLWITIENPGWDTIDATGILTLPTEIEILSTSPEAEVLSDHSVSWILDDLSFLEKRTFLAVLDVPTVEEMIEEFGSIDAALINVSASLIYNGSTYDFDEEVTFLCGYDPNDKTASSTGASIENFSLLEDDLEYTIRFQNEGNYKASNITIVDTIDSQLEITSLNVISRSHPVQTEIDINNVITFRFIDIDLPPKSENEAGSQGFVKFTISPKEGLLDNSTVLNSADIYFDHNSPIHTNTTENILVEELPIISSSSEVFDEQKGLLVFPNPSNGRFNIKSINDLEYGYKVFDSIGRLLIEKSKQKDVSQFNLEIPGLYILESTIGTKRHVEKIVVR